MRNHGLRRRSRWSYGFLGRCAVDAGVFQYVLDLAAMGGALDKLAAGPPCTTIPAVEGGCQPDTAASAPHSKWIQQSTGLRTVVVRRCESAGRDQEPGPCSGVVSTN